MLTRVSLRVEPFLSLPVLTCNACHPYPLTIRIIRECRYKHTSSFPTSSKGRSLNNAYARARVRPDLTDDLVFLHGAMHAVPEEYAIFDQRLH